MIKIGIDTGGGFLQVCLNFQERLSSHTQTSNNFLHSGVKKLFIIAIVEDVPESYYNVSLIWNILKFDELIY